MTDRATAEAVRRLTGRPAPPEPSERRPARQGSAAADGADKPPEPRRPRPTGATEIAVALIRRRYRP